MSRFLSLVILACVLSVPLTSAVGVRILPRTIGVDVDGATEMTVKRMPQGSLFVLTVNKDKDVSFYNIQWFKNGEPLAGETGQELRYPIASADHAGIYTVQMSSPCASVMSKPMQVIVEDRQFMVNSEVPQDHGVAGGTLDGSEVSGYALKECQPNPVTDRATIEFTTGDAAPVVLKIVDLNGNVVATLVNDVLPAGTHTVSIVPRDHDMNSALYYYVLAAPGFTDTKPLMLVK
jgi:hypothetical protein